MRRMYQMGNRTAVAYACDLGDSSRAALLSLMHMDLMFDLITRGDSMSVVRYVFRLIY